MYFCMINANEMVIIILYTPCMIVLLDIIYRVRRHIDKLLHVYERCVKAFLIFFNEYKNCDVTIRYKKIQMIIHGIRKVRNNIMLNIACYHIHEQISILSSYLGGFMMQRLGQHEDILCNERCDTRKLYAYVCNRVGLR